jgi:hypothetical protein
MGLKIRRALEVGRVARRGRLLRVLGEVGVVGDKPATREGARAFRLGLEELGTTYVKLGQLLSSRSDLLPDVYIECWASWWTTFRRVLLPLLSPGILAGFVYILVVSFRELSSSLLLYSPGTEVLSILMWEQFENGSFNVLAAIGVLMVLALVLMVTIAYKLGAKVGLRED